MRIFTTSEASIEMGAAYLAVAAISYPFTGVSNTYVAMLRAVNRVKGPVIISCVAIVVNIVFNYIFIFENGCSRFGCCGSGFGYFDRKSGGDLSASLRGISGKDTPCM